MSPNIKHGSFVFAFKSFFTQFKVGDIVLVNHHNYGRIIKRIYSIDGYHYSLIGDNSNSLTSDKMGFVDVQQICGKVFFISS